MPYRSGYLAKSRHRGRARRHAAGTIARAWRKRKRRKTSLVARTTLANRRAIKRINREIETKMIENYQAVVGNRYRGQWLAATQIDNNGQDTTGDVVVNLLGGIPQGAESYMHIGEWIKLKSVTYRVQVEATAGLVPDTHNLCGVMLVHDSQPQADPSNINGSGGTALDDGTLLAGRAANNCGLMFQNLLTCGKTKRYKVLKHHKFMLQPVNAGSVAPPERVFSHTFKAPYKVQYDQDTGLITNQTLKLFFYSSSTQVPHPEFTMYSRVRFVDP